MKKIFAALLVILVLVSTCCVSFAAEEKTVRSLDEWKALFEKAYREGWDGQRFEDEELPHLYADMKLEDLAFVEMDMDNNGMTDLIVLTVPSALDPEPVCHCMNVFLAQPDGSLAIAAESGERVGCVLCKGEDGEYLLRLDGADSAFSGCTLWLKPENGVMNIVDGVVYTFADDESVSFERLVNGDLQDLVPVDEEVAAQIFNAHDELPYDQLPR